MVPSSSPMPYAAGAVVGFRYVPPCLSNAQAMRAILLASATAATLVGRRAMRSASHGRLVVPRRLAWRMTSKPP